MKFLALSLLLSSSVAYAAPVYKCKTDSGRIAYQDKPCTGEVLKVTEQKSGFGNEGFKRELLKALAKMTGKSESELNDPKVRQAVEGLAAVDAGKSYAFTKIYAISAKYCGPSVQSALANYETKASDIIALGKHYYTKGIHINLGNKEISNSGQQLTEGLDRLLVKLDSEHKGASKAKRQSKCNKEEKEQETMVKHYGN